MNKKELFNLKPGDKLIHTDRPANNYIVIELFNTNPITWLIGLQEWMLIRYKLNAENCHKVEKVITEDKGNEIDKLSELLAKTCEISTIIHEIEAVESDE